jgi:glycerol uptake facilitator protein
MLVQQIAGGEIKWEQLPVYLVAELLAGVAAALLYGLLSKTPADRVKVPVDLGAPDAEPAAARQSANA